MLYVLAALGFAGMALVGLLIWLGRSDGGTATGAQSASDVAVGLAMKPAGCTLQTFHAEHGKPDHSTVPTPDTKVEWNSFPPTTGPHYGGTAVWGSYDVPLELTRVLHNLEHGGVYILYGPKVSKDIVSEIKDFWKGDPNGLIVAPQPGLGNKVALGAWVFPEVHGEEGVERGVLAKCTSFDESAYRAFLTAYRFKGPEVFPPDSMVPGA